MTDHIDLHDPHFPSLHRVHRRGWINDPNGILRTEDGRWHVFFQHNPASTRHEDILWGHMSSEDLVVWREEPHGPTPRPGEVDQDGCWSGIGLLDRAGDGDAVPTLVYSGVDGVENQLARVVVSRLDGSGTRLLAPGRVVAEVPQIDGLFGVRDPFVFEAGGRRWAIQGAGARDGDRRVPTLPLYACDDLDRWEHVGSLLDGDDPVAAEHAPADLWECPQLVPVGRRWVLLLSRWLHPDHAEVSTIQVDYLIGDLVEGAGGAPRFAPTAGGRVDLGPDFYAPQAVVDPEAERCCCGDGPGRGKSAPRRRPKLRDGPGCSPSPESSRSTMTGSSPDPPASSPRCAERRTCSSSVMRGRDGSICRRLLAQRSTSLAPHRSRSSLPTGRSRTSPHSTQGLRPSSWTGACSSCSPSRARRPPIASIRSRARW